MTIVKEYTLDFCHVQYRDDGIVELEINEGVNIDADMASQLVGMAEVHIGKPFGMISNRIHSFSLSFEAMSTLAHYEKLAALAIVVHSTKSRLLVETQNFFIGALKKKPIQIFMDVASAESWLQNTLRALEDNAKAI